MTLADLDVITVSGFVGSGKTSLLRHVGGADASVTVPDAGGSMVDLRELERVVRRAHRSGAGRVLLETSATAAPSALVEAVTHALPGFARVSLTITVVDALRFRPDARAAAEPLGARALTSSDEDPRSVSDTVLDQVEFADVLVVNKLDLLPPRDHGALMGLLHALNPRARIVPCAHGRVPASALARSPRFDRARTGASSGWHAVRRGDRLPAPLTGFVYRAHRPFEAERLWRRVHHPWPGVLHSRGRFWLAQRPRQVGSWSCIDGTLTMQTDPAFPDTTCDQELVFIGAPADEATIRRDLDACLLRDAELNGGPEVWRSWPDPFEAWDKRHTSP